MLKCLFQPYVAPLKALVSLQITGFSPWSPQFRWDLNNEGMRWGAHRKHCYPPAPDCEVWHLMGWGKEGAGVHTGWSSLALLSCFE